MLLPCPKESAVHRAWLRSIELTRKRKQFFATFMDGTFLLLHLRAAGLGSFDKVDAACFTVAVKRFHSDLRSQRLNGRIFRLRAHNARKPFSQSQRPMI